MADEAASNEEASTVSDLTHRVGQDLSDLMQSEVESAKAELTDSAKGGAEGAGLVGGGAVAGAMALLFGSIAIWRAVGVRIGYAKSAALVAAVYGTAAVVFSARGGEQLAQVAKRLR